MSEPITVFTANCVGNETNCIYPNVVRITDTVSAKQAFCRDQVFARYKGNYRSNDYFEWSNALPADCDNDHSDDPKDWITEKDIAEMFSDVTYILHFSRHHDQPKGNKSARPRFHVIFLISPEDNMERYVALKKRLLKLFPFFDHKATDAARFLFGTEIPEVIFHQGICPLDEVLDMLDSEQAFAEMERVIPEGTRNNTLSRYAACIVKRYGYNDEAKELFLQVSGQCVPPLEDDEVEGIWRGKERFYEKMRRQPGYVPPEAYNAPATVIWDTPIPFDDYVLPEFPVEALPEIVRRYVLAVSESTQTPVDMAAVEALGVAALCAQGKYVAHGGANWSEPINLYLVVVLPPAERKSSVLAMMIGPVEEYEKEINTSMSAEIIKSRMMLDKLEKEKRSLIEQAAKGKATEEEIKAKAVEIARFESVKPVRLFVDDVTSEKLTSVLAENKGRAAVVSAEGGIFDIISGLYTKNVNIDVFLKGHSGDTIRVDRIGRASESIIHPALTMILAVQPEVLNGLMSNNTFRGRGLTARFLYSMPRSSVGKRSFNSMPIPEKAREGYMSLIRALLAENGDREPITLSDGARDVLEALFNEVEQRLHGDLADVADWGGKFVGAVLRISALLHIMKYPTMPMFCDVEKDTMESAVAIGRYFLEHAKAAYALMGADETNKNAQYLLTAITRERLAEFSRRDAMRLCRRFKTAESLQPVLNRLCEYGYLAVKPSAVLPSFGRKVSEVYLTNPALLGA